MTAPDHGPGDVTIGLDADVLGQALLQAGAADPADVIARLRTLLTSATSAIDLVLYLVDYRLASLRAVNPHMPAGLLPPALVAESNVGVAFREQRTVPHPVPTGQLLHVPVTVRAASASVS